jgi:hypothetical protein
MAPAASVQVACAIPYMPQRRDHCTMVAARFQDVAFIALSAWRVVENGRRCLVETESASARPSM